MKLFLSLAFLISLVSALEVKAEVPTGNGKRVCKSEFITGRCAEFASSAFGAMIYLPDGTSFRNPAKVDQRFVYQSSLMAVPADQEQYEKLYQEVRRETDLASMNLQKKLCEKPDSFCNSGLIINLTATNNSILMYRLGWDGSKFTEKPLDLSSGHIYGAPSKFLKFDWKAKAPVDLTPVTPLEFANSLNELPPKQKKIVGEYLNQLQVIQKKTPWYQNLLSNIDQDAKNKSFIETRRKSLGPLANKAKLSIIKRLLASQVDTSVLTEANIESFDLSSFRNVSPDLAEMALKVQSTKIQLHSSNQELCNSMNSIDGRDAQYSPLSHSVSVCDEMLKAPDAHLVVTLAHEIGHSIDPCNISSGLYKYDRQVLGTYENKGTANRTNADKIRLSGFKLFQGDLVLGSPEKYFSEKFANELLQAGFVESFGGVVGLPSNQNALTEIRQCLQEKGGFRIISKSEFDAYIIPKIEKAIESRKDLSPGSRSKYIERAKEEFAKDPICNSVFVSELTEASSDLWGSIALGDYLKENRPVKPKKNSQDPNEFARYFAALGPFLSCPADASNAVLAEDTGSYQLSAFLKQELKNSFDREMDPHPNVDQRTNKLILGNPEVAELFGCDPDLDTKTCFISANKIKSVKPKLKSPDSSSGSKDSQK